MKIRLGVNVDHVATIRNARGEKHPDPYFASKKAIKYGADTLRFTLTALLNPGRDVKLSESRVKGYKSFSN